MINDGGKRSLFSWILNLFRPSPLESNIDFDGIFSEQATENSEFLARPVAEDSHPPRTRTDRSALTRTLPPPRALAAVPSSGTDSPPAPSVEGSNFRDSLTGLLNEAGYKHALLRELQLFLHNKRRYKGERPFIFYLDLNGVKAVNDDLGHDAGDVMLKGAGDVPVYGILREGEHFSRLHGDEYAAIIHAKDVDDGRERGEELRDAMFEGVKFRIEESCELFGISPDDPAKAQLSLKAARTHFSVAIGFAPVPDSPGRGDQQSAEALAAEVIARADKAMYREKQVHHLISAQDTCTDSLRNLKAFDQSFETITDWLDSRESGLSLDTRTELLIQLKRRDDLRWKVGLDAVNAKEPWLVDLVPGLLDPGFQSPPALVVDAGLLVELRTRLGIRKPEETMPGFLGRPSAGAIERLQANMETVAAFDYSAADHGVNAYGKSSALVRNIPRAPGPLKKVSAVVQASDEA